MTIKDLRKFDLVVMSHKPDATMWRVLSIDRNSIEVIDAAEESVVAPQLTDLSLLRRPTKAQLDSFNNPVETSIKITNVADPSVLTEYLESPQGERVISEFLQRKKEKVSASGFNIGNADRAAWAGEVIELFADLTGMSSEYNDTDTVVCDLLANLMHYCDKEEIDFDEALRMAEVHYIAEVRGDQ
jgi:hypothetical protein